MGGAEKHTPMTHREGTRDFTYVIVFAPSTAGAPDTRPSPRIGSVSPSRASSRSEFGCELRCIWVRSLCVLFSLPLVGY